MQFKEGMLVQLEGTVFRITDPRNERDCFARFLGTRSIAVSIIISGGCPDRNKAVPAPRLDLVESDLAKVRMIAALQGDTGLMLTRFGMIGNDTRWSSSCEIGILFGTQGIGWMLTVGNGVPS